MSMRSIVFAVAVLVRVLFFRTRVHWEGTMHFVSCAVWISSGLPVETVESKTSDAERRYPRCTGMDVVFVVVCLSHSHPVQKGNTTPSKQYCVRFSFAFTCTFVKKKHFCATIWFWARRQVVLLQISVWTKVFFKKQCSFPGHWNLLLNTQHSTQPWLVHCVKERVCLWADSGCLSLGACSKTPSVLQRIYFVSCIQDPLLFWKTLAHFFFFARIVCPQAYGSLYQGRNI